MIVFGGRATNIGNFDIPDTTCDYCQNSSTQRVSVFGKYTHIFWIPIFPIGKKAVAECTHCKKTIEQKDFSPELRQLYKVYKGQAKRPIWHWFGLGLIGFLVVLITIIGVTSEGDPRSEFLNADESAMISNPTMETDSISYKIKQIFDSFATDEIDPTEFKYLTKIEGEKALVLVQIPKLRKVKKEGRSQALEMVELITDSQADLEGKDMYIGIKGAVTMMIIKTPTYEKNSKLALVSELYDYYGPKPAVEE